MSKDLDLDALDLEGLEDFDSEELTADEAADDESADLRGRNKFVSDLWTRYGFESQIGDKSSADQARAIVTAHRIVQSFVDTFAVGRYRVTFDPTVTTAGTDLVGKAVVVTPAPLFDETISAEQAGVILTAMATHEASHDRYGRSTYLACTRAFGKRRAPNKLSNILDDVRIERRFAAEFPGYADVFRPMLDYVAASSVRTRGRVKPSMNDQVNLAGLAIRYHSYVEWPVKELRDERDWWRAWADRWAPEDAPRRHVEAVREGLRHVAAVKALRESRAQSSPTGDLGRIKQGIEALTPPARRAVRLASQGLPGKEIAARMGLSLDDAKTLIRSARKQMLGAS